jgi:3-hydroxyisobutyrate dehydrogenase-like beta-hydroxyacid dehydrogenase
MEIGFIGIGQMGRGMAANLLAAGHRLRVYNRSPDKLAPLLEQGAQAASTPREAAAGAELVFTMLADDAALEAVCAGEAGLFAGLGKGAIHVSSSTISVALARRLEAEHAARGQRLLGAPVFGRPDAAAAAQLFVVAAGPAEDLSRAQPALEAIGQRLFVMGEAPWMAHLVKLAGNFLIAATIEMLGEAFALIRKNGVKPEAFLDFLSNSLFAAPVVRNYGRIIVEERFKPAGFRLPLGLKDVKLALAAAEGAEMPLPLASLLRDHFLTLLAQGGADLDWSALAALAATQAGLPSPKAG